MGRSVSVLAPGARFESSALRVPTAAMRQVMSNLLLNAADAAGDRRRVHARLQARADAVRSGRRRLDQNVAMQLSNNSTMIELWKK